MLRKYLVRIFNDQKPEESKKKILLINASNEFIPLPSIERPNSLVEDNN